MKKDKDSLYVQYDKIKWKNQEKTKLNYLINNKIIEDLASDHEMDEISVYDIGFGIGYFIKMLYYSLAKKYKKIIIEGCEPSIANYEYFLKKNHLKIRPGDLVEVTRERYQSVEVNRKFDYITAIYILTNIVFEELDIFAKKAYSMLENGGKFILVVPEEKYITTKINLNKDLFIDSRTIELDNKKYWEVHNYSIVPKIGKLLNYNREERFYVDLFKKNGLELMRKENLDDSGFICTYFTFEKMV